MSPRIDWEAEGLLGELTGAAREARERLLKDLHHDGVTLEELREAAAEDRLALLPVERILGRKEDRLTAEQVAARLDTDVDRVQRTRRALGLPVAEPDDPVFSEDDVRGLEVGLSLERTGISEERRLEVARVIGRAMSQVAEVMRSVSMRTFREPGANERDISLRYAEAARSSVPFMGSVLESALAAHLREQIKQDVVAAADLASGHVPGTTEVAVAFADLVDFTRLGEELPTEEVGALARRLEELTEDVVSPPVRLVKMIGDATMLVSREPEALLEAVMALFEAGEAAGEEFPLMRAGLAHGEAVGQGGDWYGRPVNLASRVTEIARPGSVLATEAIRDAVDTEAWSWSFAGKRRIRGIRDETPLYRVRRRQRDGTG